MPEPFEILFIDDEAAAWLPVLGPAAQASGFHLLSAECVEEGLELLEQYGALVDAVVLSLDVDGSREGLMRLKALYPKLPVLLLAADVTAEHFAAAMEGVRLGAYDGFAKTTLDPERLVEQVQEALTAHQPEPAPQSDLERHDEPHLLVEPAEAGASPAVGFFAFVLDRIATPRDEDEQEDAVAAALSWHRSLLSALALCGPDVRFHLRYTASPQQSQEKKRTLDVALIAAAEGPTPAEARIEACRLRQELRAHLHGSQYAGAGVYHFLPVQEEKVLRRLLVPLLPRDAMHLTRRTATGHLPAVALALKGYPLDPGTSQTLQLPLALPADAYSSLRHLLYQMTEQASGTLVDIVLRPAWLTADELALLRAFTQRETLERTGLSLQYLTSERLSLGEEQSFISRAEQLVEEGSRCFEIALYLAQDRNRVSSSLQGATAGDFFGRVARVEMEPAYAVVSHGALQLRAAGQSKRDRLACLYTMEEAARVFRLPLPLEGETPGLPSTHPAYEAVPEDLPAEGPVLGVKKTGLERQIVRLHPHDLRRHVYILGQTGTGKTTVLASMLQERLEAGAGVGLIDPHGDLFDAVHRAVPKRHREDVVLFDPADPASPARLNLLEYDPRYPDQKTVLIEEMFGIFRQEYDMKVAGGPMFETYMRNALLLVMDNPAHPGTLLDVVKVFQNDRYREAMLKQCRNPLVVAFWREEAEQVGSDREHGLRNITPYITSKLNAFIYNDYLRRLVDERKSTIDFRQVIDAGKVLLVRLSKGRLGGFGVRLFGTVLFARILMAALSREDTPEDKRRDFFLFVDEFQHFTSEATASMLSEARKYRLALVLANQTLGQLEDRILRAVLGNTGSLVFFRPGVEDYERIKPYVTPPFTREEMLGLPNYTAMARLLIEGRPALPFLLQTRLT